jgi:uncharacterized protein GlcG (DUF336 family)
MSVVVAAAAPATGQPAPSDQAAMDAANAAVDACQAKDYSVVAAVVDSTGQAMASVTGVGASDQSETAAVRKARASVVFGIPSAEVAARSKTDAAVAKRLQGDEDLLAAGGAVPLRIGGQLIGAVGVDGAPSPEADTDCAAAAAAKLAKAPR